MPGLSGLDVIRTMAARGKFPPIVMVTGTGNERIAVEAMKLGVSDYLVKDLEGGFVNVLPLVVGRAIEQRRLLREKQRMEKELAQAQRMEAIGQLAAGIAHEINTPTQYIGDNARFLQDAFADIGGLLDSFGQLLQAARTDSVTDELLTEMEAKLRAADLGYLTREIPQAIQQSLEGVEHVASIVGAMKEFSHPGNGGKQAVDLNHVIAGAITLCRSEWKYVAEVVTDFDPELPAVRCLPTDINSVVLNLVVNAAHAIAEATHNGADGKGVITIRTRLRRALRGNPRGRHRRGHPRGNPLRESSTSSSPPRKSAREPARGSRWPTRSWSKNTAERSTSRPRSAGEPPSSSGCRSTDNRIARPADGAGRTKNLRKNWPSDKRQSSWIAPSCWSTTTRTSCRAWCASCASSRSQVYTARSGEEAIRLPKTRKIDVIVADERMPGMSGVQLLTWVAENCPDVMRIVLTAPCRGGNGDPGDQRRRRVPLLHESRATRPGWPSPSAKPWSERRRWKKAGTRWNRSQRQLSELERLEPGRRSSNPHRRARSPASDRADSRVLPPAGGAIGREMDSESQTLLAEARKAAAEARRLVLQLQRSCRRIVKSESDYRNNSTDDGNSSKKWGGSKTATPFRHGSASAVPEGIHRRYYRRLKPRSAVSR